MKKNYVTFFSINMGSLACTFRQIFSVLSSTFHNAHHFTPTLTA